LRLHLTQSFTSFSPYFSLFSEKSARETDFQPMHEKILPDSIMKCYQARSSDGRRKAFDSESTGFRDAPFKKTGTAERSLYGSPTLGYDSLLNNGRMYFFNLIRYKPNHALNLISNELITEGSNYLRDKIAKLTFRVFRFATGLLYQRQHGKSPSRDRYDYFLC